MSYTPTTWVNGDTITATKLNKMEQGIAEGGGGSAIFEEVAVLAAYTDTGTSDSRGESIRFVPFIADPQSLPTFDFLDTFTVSADGQTATFNGVYFQDIIFSGSVNNDNGDFIKFNYTDENTPITFNIGFYDYAFSLPSTQYSVSVSAINGEVISDDFKAAWQYLYNNA